MVVFILVSTGCGLILPDPPPFQDAEVAGEEIEELMNTTMDMSMSDDVIE